MTKDGLCQAHGWREDGDRGSNSARDPRVTRGDSRADPFCLTSPGYSFQLSNNLSTTEANEEGVGH